MNTGTKTRTVDSNTPPDYTAPQDAVLAPPSATNDERAMQHEILNRLVRAVSPVMKTAKKPALVWAILEGVFLDQKTVAEVCAEEQEPRKTADDILAKLCAALNRTRNALQAV